MLKTIRGGTGAGAGNQRGVLSAAGERGPGGGWDWESFSAACVAEYGPSNWTKSLPAANAAMETINSEAGTNGVKTPTSGQPAPPSGPKDGSGSLRGTRLNQLRNELTMTARRLATTTKCLTRDVVEQATGGALNYGDIGRLGETDVPKLRVPIARLATAAGTATQ